MISAKNSTDNGHYELKLIEMCVTVRWHSTALQYILSS